MRSSARCRGRWWTGCRRAGSPTHPIAFADAVVRATRERVGDCVDQLPRRSQQEQIRNALALRARTQAQLEIDVGLLGDLLAEELCRPPAVDAPHDLAEHEAVRHGVIADLRAAAVPMRLGRDVRGDRIPIVQAVNGIGGSKPGTPPRWVIASRTVTRPCRPRRTPANRCHGRIEIDEPAIDQHQERHDRRDLGRREHDDDRVALPRPRPRRVGVASPQIDDRSALVRDRQRRADLEAVVEVGAKASSSGSKRGSQKPWIVDRRGHAWLRVAARMSFAAACERNAARSASFGMACGQRVYDCRRPFVVPLGSGGSRRARAWAWRAARACATAGCGSRSARSTRPASIGFVARLLPALEAQQAARDRFRRRLPRSDAGRASRQWR